MRSPVIAVASLCLVAAAACGTDPDRSSGQDPQDDAALRDIAADVSYDNAAAGMRALGSDLVAVLPRDNGNLVYSPASLALAFAMLREGAEGDTAAQLDDVLHLPADRREAYNALIHQLADDGGTDVLDVNQAMFMADGFDLRPAYIKTVQGWYGADVEQTRFPEPGLADVNRWVDERTNGRVPRLFDDLDPATVLVLLNTIYLDAEWADPFDKDETEPGFFITGPGEHVTVDLMNDSRRVDYAEGDGWQAVRLPYADGTMSMWVLLPRRGGDPAAMLDAAVLKAAEDGFRERHVNLELPRWDLGSKLDLRTALSSLGLKDAWLGDYSGIAGEPGDLAVDQVVQQANITVGEKGTVAAAATGISVFRTSAHAPPDGLVFRADHPFAFVVMHDKTGVPLFEGVVSDPS